MKLILFRIFILIGLVSLTGCCDALFFTYNVDINFSINENRVPVNNSFDIIIEIPDVLVSNEGDENDISDLDFEFTLTSYNYSADTTISFWDFEVSTQSLDIQSERLEDNETFVIGEPTELNTGREMRFRITPTVRDTILLTLGTRGTQEGRGQCAPSHQLIPINNQLSLEESGLNITQIGNGEVADNAIIIEVF